MNSDEITDPSSPSTTTTTTTTTSTGRRIRVRSLKRPSISQEASLPSIPSDDNDWVSPFTLPPLPALRKNRTQLDRSPEDRIHNRSGSSAYYAAAWGSPYATPSPNQSPATRLHQNKSLDLESSPLVSRRLPGDRSLLRHTRQQSLPIHDSSEKETDLPLTTSPVDAESKHQRRNWLSESEDSQSEYTPESGQTPTRRKRIAQASVPSSVRSHHVQESVDTITPETFNGASSLDKTPGRPSASHIMTEAQSPSPASVATEGQSKEKPLPSLPGELTTNVGPPVVHSRPSLPLPIQSFNRPKKKVPWHGKSLIIAMPTTDREQAGLPPVLTAKEREDIIQKWADQGYPVRGFSVDDWASIINGSGGASRATFPDFDDMEQERKTTRAGVHIPNQGEWQAWVNYLKEEKLRALGVTPSTSEAAPSTMSPFSSTTISRVSSAYPSMAASPPIPPMSAASTQSRMAHSPFSPVMANPATVGFSALSQRGTPQLPNGQRPMHGYTQSIAIPGVNQRIVSPFDYSISHPAAFGSGMRSPNDQFSGRRPFSPGHVQNMQSMSRIISPANMNPSPQDFARNFHSNPQVAHIQRQQEVIARQQQQIQAQIARAQHQRQMSMFPLRALSTEQLPLTPKAVSPEREPPGIMQPTPRSHRHNLSAALEKGVSESVAASSKGLADVVHGEKLSGERPGGSPDDIEEGEIQEDEAEQEELPILPRPETLNNADEKEEIETNPSIAGTPLLLDDKNPFLNFKPLLPPPSSGQRPAFGHSAQPSLSKLNVQAKEFNPSGSFAGGNLNLNENAFAPKPLLKENPISSRPQLRSHQRNMSSLNVEAPVFTPSFFTKPPQEEPKKEAATESVTNISSSAESTFDPRTSTFSFTSAPTHAHETTPAQSDFDPRSSAFSFTSANFDVEAPEFKPAGSPSGIEFTPEKPLDSRGSIFGDVVIEPSSKPQRRNKALPIIKPRSREGTPADTEESFGMDGRAVAPSDRQKRVRTGGKDEDDKLLFAESAPFSSLADDRSPEAAPAPTDGVAESVEDVAESVKDSNEPSVEEPVAGSIEVHENAKSEELDKSQPTPEEPVAEPVSKEASAQPTPAAEEIAAQSAASEKDDLQGQEPIKSATPIQLTQQEQRSHKLEQPLPKVDEPQPKDELEVTEAETAHKENIFVSEPAATTSSTKDVEEQASITMPALSAEAPIFRPASAATHKSNSSLSALATPFEFQSVAQDFKPNPEAEPTSVPDKEKEPTPKKGGLMASRFAASSPEPGTPETVERLSSPLKALSAEAEQMQDQVHDTEDKSESREVPLVAEDVVELIDVEADPQADELDRISNLEDDKENVSRSGSVVSRVGDMSIEEINAVMKQFEENPDLGIIREDTPVEETPLIDMRFPRQNFRSDAPSPSPRRLNKKLDQPFDPDRARPYGGLGFEIEGVHQLNYGSGEISDWNADLSPGQQDKLEARAHFFDDHVNDLVDNVLESRLAPVERALANIQHAVQSVVGKPRGSRRSLSTDNKDSDADDEDDYDAYEGYSHYRSMSPKRRDRRQETIKAAVIEAMSVAQAAAVQPQIDMTSIQSALQEMRELAQKTIVQSQQPAIDTSVIHTAISELKSLAVQEPKAPVLDTSDLSRILEEMKALQQQRALEPQADMLVMQAALNELRQLVSEKPRLPELDLSSLHESLAELKQQGQSRSVQEESASLKTVLEDVISSHPRLRGSRVEQDHDSSQKLHLKIDGLEAMLKVAEKRADGEAALRREAEDENDTLRAHLKDAQDQAATHKEASDEAQRSLEAFLSEKQQYREMSAESRDLRSKNEALEQRAEALEKTLNEYRVYKEEMREELDAERKRTDNLARHLQDVRVQARDQMDSRDVLRDQLGRLQQRMTRVMEDIRHDEAEWRKREHDIMGKNQLLQCALDHETHRRARLELDAEKLRKEHRESLHFKALHDNAQGELSKLANTIIGLQAENKSHQDASYQAQRELTYLREKQEEMIASQTGRLLDELEASRAMLRNLQSDSDARIARLQGQIDTAAVEIREQKAEHEQHMQRMFENHNHAIRQVNEKHADELEQALRQVGEKHKADLEHRLAVHEERLIDFQNRHVRDLQSADEDRSRLEQKYMEKLDLSNDKVKHLEGKLSDLEDRFEVTKTAARAAVEAATAKAINLPTPAPSVVASPPHRGSISSASMPIARGSDLPEKISAQALRETIMVLQDQLQNREQKIDKLEAELASIDKDAPNKIKERETEVVMLRELLDVRVDDLQELISTLEKPQYDRAAVKDAAIRIKTQIKMEQQLKERAISGTNLANNLPASISSGLANLTQSPRAMVAAAAWGNWRRVRDSGVSAVSDFANSVSAQTPSRSSSTPSNLLAGIMTPPSASQRSQGDGSQPSTARPLAAAAAARRTGVSSPSKGAQPLRAFNSQPRALSGAHLPARRETNESRPGSSGSVIRPSEPSSTIVEPPSTPLALKAESDFGDDVDDDASPLDGKDRGFDSDNIEELVNSERNAMKSVSPRASRESTRLDDEGEEEERVVVLEEE
ncbi:hypothetical protein H2198_009527 [Neophaeococcomyces mojaviensis]|uniref:Uncharacterized protein n=1 Tax=Neophaeococcomyces mojaviensis TaxID=3383035 RepID=A0ACC2ZUB2_9EURO|nr:hypothetical protein H2198_009527 [Knufia sp. JES_112]